MTVERIELDRSKGRIGWRHGGGEVRVAVADLADAVVDPASGRIVALSRTGPGRLLLFEPDGGTAGAIDAPDGYALSHFVAGADGLAIVGQGESPRDGWPDWHFLIDGRGGRLHRAGPAY